MSSLKSLLLVLSVVAVGGFFQVPAGATMIDQWLLNTNPISYGCTCSDSTSARPLTCGTDQYTPTTLQKADLPTSVPGPFGMANTAVHFDGTGMIFYGNGANSQYSGYTYWPCHTLSNYTIEAFFNVDSPLSSAEQVIYEEGEKGGPDLGLEIRGGYLYFQAKNSSGSWQNVQLTSPGQLSTGVWYYAAVVVSRQRAHSVSLQ